MVVAPVLGLAVLLVRVVHVEQRQVVACAHRQRTAPRLHDTPCYSGGMPMPEHSIV